MTTLPRTRGEEFRGLFYSRRIDGGVVVKRLWTNSAAFPLAGSSPGTSTRPGPCSTTSPSGAGTSSFCGRRPSSSASRPSSPRSFAARGSSSTSRTSIPDLAIESGILRNPAGIRFAKALEKWVYGLADTIAVISDGFARNLRSKGVPEAKLAVLPNWVDTDFLRPGPKDNPVSRRHGLDGKFVVMYSGTISISSHRALERALEAAALLAGDREILFVVVGEGLKKESLRAKAAALGLANAVFLPFVPYPELPDLLASSDVLLVPLDRDKSDLSVPSKLYTFMAAGRPILGLASPDSEVATLLRRERLRPDRAPGRPGGDRRRRADAQGRAGTTARARRQAREYVVRRFAKDAILRSYDALLSSVVS